MCISEVPVGNLAFYKHLLECFIEMRSLRSAHSLLASVCVCGGGGGGVCGVYEHHDVGYYTHTLTSRYK